MVFQQAETLLQEYLNAREQKLTRQRKIILAIFFEASTHLTIEEIHKKVVERNAGVGIATVYRMVKILCDCGLVIGFRNTDGSYKYELGQEYHEHLICIKCGRVLEIVEPSDEVSAIIRSIKNFKVLHSRLELYGVCRECVD